MSCSNSFRQLQEKPQETWVQGTEFGVCHYTSAPLCTGIGRKSHSVRMGSSKSDCTQWESYTAPQPLTSQPPGAGLLLDAQGAEGGVWRAQETHCVLPCVSQQFGNAVEANYRILIFPRECLSSHRHASLSLPLEDVARCTRWHPAP